MTAHVRPSSLGLAATSAVFVALRTAAAFAGDVVFEDETVRMKVPPEWNVTGEAGEYWLEWEQQVASLLLLPPDPDMPLEVRLAEIEEQFLSTGVIHREKTETRPPDARGEVVHYRRYRLSTGADVDTASIVLHEYSFVRSGVRVLLQVETPPEAEAPEDLFAAIHRSLEVRVAPDPFEDAVDPSLPDTSSVPADSAAG
jgi:hypothetical protein